MKIENGIITMFNLLKRKKTISIGQNIAVTLYKGSVFEDADFMRRYLQAHKDSGELLLVEDAKGNDVHVKIDKVVFDEQYDMFNNVKYIVRLKGVICND